MINRSLLASRNTLLGGALLTAFSVQAGAVTLDDFNTSQGSNETPAVESSGALESNTLSIGGGISRILTAQRTAGTNTVRAFVDNGRYQYSQDTGAFGVGTIVWENVNQDLCSEEAFVLTIASQDLPATFTLAVDGGSTSITQNDRVLAGQGTTLSFAFSRIGFNCANVGTITLTIDGTGTTSQDLDVQLDSLATTPAPVQPTPVPGISTWGLMISLAGLPLLAGFFASRRKRR